MTRNLKANIFHSASLAVLQKDRPRRVEGGERLSIRPESTTDVTWYDSTAFICSECDVAGPESHSYTMPRTRGCFFAPSQVGVAAGPRTKSRPSVLRTAFKSAPAHHMRISPALSPTTAFISFSGPYDKISG